MKILIVLRAMANIAGTERVMSDKINWLAEKGHQIILVTYEQGSHPLSFSLHSNVKVVDLDTRFFQLNCYPIYKRFWKYRRLKAVFAERLQKIIDEVSPDVIIATTYSMNIVEELSKIRTKAKKIMESHVACNSVSKAYDYRSSFIMKNIVRLYDSYLFKKVDRFDKLVVLTEGDKKDWSRYVKNVIALPNPLTYYPEQKPSKNINHRILCVGRLNEQKGFDLLIDAFAMIASKCPEWYIDIFGHGEEKQALLNQIKKNGLENRIHICNPTDSIYHEYEKSDFYVLSSRYEGFGLVLIEAMSCGTPCVAFDCNYGPNEIIEDGVDGLLVKNGDIGELSKKMLWMMTHDKERMEMGKKAYVSAARYNKEFVMQEWECTYISA